MAGEGSDGMKFHTGTRQIGQAEVAQRVSAETRHLSLQSDPANDLRSYCEAC